MITDKKKIVVRVFAVFPFSKMDFYWIKINL